MAYQPKTFDDLFRFYNKPLKPLYSEIQAKTGELPIELLIEVQAAFDHLRRRYTDNQSIEECVDKAYGHLKRGALDALKLKLKNYNKTYMLLTSKPYISLVDNGAFLKKLHLNKTEIYNKAKEARLNESILSLDKWYDVSFLIDTFYHDCSVAKKSISWAKCIYYRNFAFLYLLPSVIIGLIATILSNFYIKAFLVKFTN